ncbi:hypothetical protein U8D42_03240 [Mycobacterium europaeum]|uniref:hypothetical protein n=1 Tax=Mycobacterium europaeum TaxID=761804 RepID=UPI002ADF556B|nr:hypothetical protein [Mycobacterium europaeum]MEA1159427.1 hypothetical protein [Mycobacterium europaeum]
MTDSPENYPDWDDLTDEQRWQVAELSALIETLDREQTALDKIAHDDPIGVVAFGDRDEWIDKRLNPKDAPDELG